MNYSMAAKGGMIMTEELIREVKHIQRCLAAKDMRGDEWEEKQEIINKLEAVSDYLKDALGKGIEF